MKQQKVISERPEERNREDLQWHCKDQQGGPGKHKIASELLGAALDIIGMVDCPLEPPLPSGPAQTLLTTGNLANIATYVHGLHGDRARKQSNDQQDQNEPLLQEGRCAERVTRWEDGHGGYRREEEEHG